jgi:O-antigen ligase
MTAAVLVVGLLLGLLRGLDSLQARIDGAGQEEEVADFRLVLNRQSAEMFKDHPLVGIGWNQYGLANSRPQGAYSWVIEEWNRERNHVYGEEGYTSNALTESLYWLHLAENGILGTVAYGVFLLVTLLLVVSAAWRRRSDLTALGLLIVLVITYAHGTLERVLVQPKNLSAWLILVAIVAGAARERVPTSLLSQSRTSS